MMTEREVWLKASEVVAAHGNEAARYVLNSLGNVFASSDRVEDWRRVAAAVDFIMAASLQ